MTAVSEIVQIDTLYSKLREYYCKANLLQHIVIFEFLYETSSALMVWLVGI